MKIQLPKRINGDALSVDFQQRELTIIGANGAGKTRFARALAESLGSQACRLSALRALYRPLAVGKKDEGFIDQLYLEAVAGSTIIRGDIEGELNRLIALLLHEEMVNLMDFKAKRMKKPDLKFRRTRMDKMISVWQEIFPDNRILLEGGQLSISRFNAPAEEGGGDENAYDVLRLSDGEKAVMYHVGAALCAPKNSVFLIDNPGMFLHPSTVRVVWDSVEALRPDCFFIYITHDLDFASSRGGGNVLWVQSYNPVQRAWKYDLLPDQDNIPEDVYMAIVGSRKPVLFIEGDGKNSIDSKLYPLLFKEYTVKSLGSCNKVIEATRTFNDLNAFHSLASIGIVDRDRRDEGEVAYLRRKKVMVPDVAEIENILMLEEVVRAVASYNGQNEETAFMKVKKGIMKFFSAELKSQALLHTRHRVKRTMEYRIDGRFNSINGLEDHIVDLVKEINPRGLYEQFCRDFRGYVAEGDYASVLRVFNQKSMIPESNVARHVGLKNPDRKSYMRAVISILHTETPQAERIRNAVRRCLGLKD